MAIRKPGSPSKVRQLAGLTVAQRLDANPAVTRAEVPAAQVYYHLDFLSAAQCDTLVAMIDAHRRPSTLLSDKAGTGFRTSESCDMNRHSPDVRPIDEGIAQLLGIDPAKGETMQGQRYAPGQQFRAHHDYFHEGESYWAAMKASGGQRTWTAMIYLNDVEEGGRDLVSAGRDPRRPPPRPAARLEQHEPRRQPQRTDAARGDARRRGREVHRDEVVSRGRLDTIVLLA